MDKESFGLVSMAPVVHSSQSISPQRESSPSLSQEQDEKSLYYTISDVANILNVPQHVLRFWETRFPKLKPVKRAGGRRYYRERDIDLLKKIHYLLYTKGYTIKGARRLTADAKRLDREVYGIENVFALSEPVRNPFTQNSFKDGNMSQDPNQLAFFDEAEMSGDTQHAQIPEAAQAFALSAQKRQALTDLLGDLKSLRASIDQARAQDPIKKAA